MRANHTNSFQNLLTHWEVVYGTDAYPALSQIAHNRTYQDTERYIAIMGMAKLGGTRNAPALTSFLGDPAWMVRNATLRALTALKNPDTASAVLPLLKDPALVTRMEALSAVEALKPVGFERACAATLVDPQNYHHGAAQWVPQKSLELLIHHQPRDAATRKQISLQLISLAAHPIDPQLRPRTILALEKVSGHKVDTRMSLDQSLRVIKAALN
jgi:HEAT repeat protein